MEIYI